MARPHNFGWNQMSSADQIWWEGLFDSVETATTHATYWKKMEDYCNANGWPQNEPYCGAMDILSHSAEYWFAQEKLRRSSIIMLGDGAGAIFGGLAGAGLGWIAGGPVGSTIGGIVGSGALGTFVSVSLNETLAGGGD
jgi:hypothetical protein